MTFTELSVLFIYIYIYNRSILSYMHIALTITVQVSQKIKKIQKSGNSIKFPLGREKIIKYNALK